MGLKEAAKPTGEKPMLTTTFPCIFCDDGLMEMEYLVDRGKFLPTHSIFPWDTDDGHRVHTTGLVLECGGCHQKVVVKTMEKQ